MFFFRRYLPVARDENDNGHVRSDSSVEHHEFESPRDARREIEMMTMSQLESSGNIPVFRAQVLGHDSPSNSVEDSFHEIEEENSPSPTAVAAVRLFVWACFLFGFLMMMHGQQEKVSSDRNRSTGRLRSAQLIHLDAPWTQQSGLFDKSGRFTASLVNREDSLFQIFRFEDFSLTRDNQAFPKIEWNGHYPNRTIFVERIFNEETIFVTEPISGRYQFEYKEESHELHMRQKLVFFHHLADTGSSFVVSRPSSDDNIPTIPFDCFSIFEKLGTACKHSYPILRGTSYFYDSSSQRLVSVGTDQLTVDMNGYDASGVFVQSIRPLDGSADFSITIPFMNRYEQGVWAIQNSPSTDGFLILVATMGFPPAPVQHVVLLRDSDAGPSGTVVKLDDPELSVFRKADSIKFNVPLSTAQCSC